MEYKKSVCEIVRCMLGERYRVCLTKKFINGVGDADYIKILSFNNKGVFSKDFRIPQVAFEYLEEPDPYYIARDIAEKVRLYEMSDAPVICRDEFVNPSNLTYVLTGNRTDVSDYIHKKVAPSISAVMVLQDEECCLWLRKRDLRILERELRMNTSEIYYIAMRNLCSEHVSIVALENAMKSHCRNIGSYVCGKSLYRVNSSKAMINKEMLREFSEEHCSGGNYYIVPSSTSEMIFVDEREIEKEEIILLKDYLTDINVIELESEKILSFRVLRYNSENGDIELAA